MPAQMILVAARPAMGKSAFAFGVATANASKGALHRTGNVGAATLPVRPALAAQAHPGRADRIRLLTSARPISRLCTSVGRPAEPVAA
jgi:hypothetical protein